MVITSRGMRWAGHIAHMGEIKNTCEVLIRKSEWRRPLGRSMHRWEDNIRMDLGKIGWEHVDYASGSGEEPVAVSCEHGNESSGSIKGREFSD
jgi:hypothetical protein